MSLNFLIGRSRASDPLHDHTVVPIILWVKALQFVAGASDMRALGSSLGAAAQRLQRDGPEALAGTGPTSALILACHRLGWTARVPAQVDNDFGQNIDLKALGASTLAKLVSASHERRLWRDASERPGLVHLRAGGALTGVKKALHRKRTSKQMV